jgi:hypothetical protein
MKGSNKISKAPRTVQDLAVFKTNYSVTNCTSASQRTSEGPDGRYKPNKMKQHALLQRSISRTDGLRHKNKNAMKTAVDRGKVLEWAWRNRYQWSSHLVYKVTVSSWLWCANNNYNNRNGEADRNFEEKSAKSY